MGNKGVTCEVAIMTRPNVPRSNSIADIPLALDSVPDLDATGYPQFIEDVGLLFETVGFPRMAGRVFGWLLISQPPHQSPAQLADVLQASKGSISTMTRFLEEIGLIERVSLPGERRDYFRIRLNAWSELSKRRMAQITAFRQLAERGLQLLQAQPPDPTNPDGDRTQRLQEMYDIHAFFEAELPLMLDRWEQVHATQISPR